jgi:hypothetical protein
VAVAKGEDIKSVVGQAMGEVAAAAWAP